MRRAVLDRVLAFAPGGESTRILASQPLEHQQGEELTGLLFKEAGSEIAVPDCEQGNGEGGSRALREAAPLGAGVAAGSEGSLEAWREAWHARLSCWFLALPLPTQRQLMNGCTGALTLAFTKQLDASWRSTRVSLEPQADAASSADAAAAAEPGCEWIEASAGKLQLPTPSAFPSDVKFSLPPIPWLLPSWQQVAQLQHQVHQASPDDAGSAAALPPQLRPRARARASSGQQNMMQQYRHEPHPEEDLEWTAFGVRSGDRGAPKESAESSEPHWTAFGLGAGAGAALALGAALFVSRRRHGVRLGLRSKSSQLLRTAARTVQPQTEPAWLDPACFNARVIFG